MIRLLFLIFFIGCSSEVPTQDPKAAAGSNCNNSAECPDGLLCLQNQCIESDCITSDDCLLQEYCNDTFQCEEGCQTDTDCYSGYTCDSTSNSCQAYECRDTQLDCEIGEFCNQQTGQCYTDSRRHCLQCTEDQIYYTPPSDGICLLSEEKGACTIDIFLSASGCNVGEVCFPADIDAFLAAQSSFDLNPQVGICYISHKYLYSDTTSTEPCPRGFSSVPISYSDGTTSEPVCVGDCAYYLNNGYLD